MPTHLSPAVANLLWFDSVSATSSAGCAGEVDATILAALAGHLPNIRTDPSYPDASLEFYALLSPAPISAANLHEAARITVPGGTALIVGTADHRLGEAWRLRRTARIAGFLDLRLYRVAGSLEDAAAVVPALPAALEAFARVTSRPGWKSLLRRAALLLGIVPRAYVGIVLMGKRA
jgi:hypothetical protein